MAAVLIFSGASAVLLLLLVETILHGRQISRRLTGEWKDDLFEREKQTLVHRRWGRCLAGFLLFLALATPLLFEPALREQLVARFPPKLMMTHLALVGSLLLLTSAQLRFNGRERPVLHRKVGWVVLVIGIGVVMTGMMIAVKCFLRD